MDFENDLKNINENSNLIDIAKENIVKDLLQDKVDNLEVIITVDEVKMNGDIEEVGEMLSLGLDHKKNQENTQLQQQLIDNNTTNDDEDENENEKPNIVENSNMQVEENVEEALTVDKIEKEEEPNMTENDHMQVQVEVEPLVIEEIVEKSNDIENITRLSVVQLEVETLHDANEDESKNKINMEVEASGGADLKDLNENDLPFYQDAATYWSKIEPSVDGMLGGLGFLSNSDIKESARFLRTIYKLPDAPGKSYAIDCGCGVGRIAKNFLTNHFSKVDLVDQDQKFIDQAVKNLEGNPKVGEFFCSGLHKFVPQPQKYDVIWIQWVLNYLTDEDLMQFLNRCSLALRSNGMIIIKENCTSSNNLELDNEDSSMTRPFSHFMDIFKKADLKVVKYAKQKNFPKELYPVWIFALKIPDRLQIA